MFTQNLNKLDDKSTAGMAIGFLIAVVVFTIFLVGYDQGQILSVVEGQSAFDTKWIHEFTHDMRHAAGFPCH